MDALAWKEIARGAAIAGIARAGYELVGKIKDYYKPNDDKLIFAKRLLVEAPVTVTESEGDRVPAVVRVEAPDPVLTAG